MKVRKDLPVGRSINTGNPAVDRVLNTLFLPIQFLGTLVYNLLVSLSKKR